MKTCLCWWLTLGLEIFLGSANAEPFVPSTPEQDEIKAFGKLIQPGEPISTIQVITMQIFAARYLASGRHEDASRVCTAISRGNDTEGAREFATMCLSNSRVMAGRFDEAEAIILAALADSTSLHGAAGSKHAGHLILLANYYRARGFFLLADKALEQAQNILEKDVIPAIPDEVAHGEKVKRVNADDQAQLQVLQGDLTDLNSRKSGLLNASGTDYPPKDQVVQKQVADIDKLIAQTLKTYMEVTTRFLDRAQMYGTLSLHLHVLRTRWELTQILGQDAQGFTLLQRIAMLAAQYDGQRLQPKEALSGYRYLKQKGALTQARVYLSAAKSQARADIGYPSSPLEPLPTVFNNPGATSLFGGIDRSGIVAGALVAMGNVYLEEGNFVQARRFLMAGLPGTEFASGKDSDNVAALQYDLARVDRGEGLLGKALERLRDAFQIVLMNDEESALLPGGRAIELMQTREKVALELIDLLHESPGLVSADELNKIVFEAFQSLHRQSIEASISAASMRQAQTATDKSQLIEAYLTTGRHLATIRKAYAELNAGEVKAIDAQETGTRLASELELQKAKFAELKIQLTAAGVLKAADASRKHELGDVQRVLSKREVLLQFAFSSERGYVLATTRDGQRLVPIKRVRSEFRGDVETLVRELAPNRTDTQAATRSFSLDIAHRLFQESLSTVLEAFPEAERLLLVADGVWEGLPLSVLVGKSPGASVDVADYDKIDWLFRRYELAYLPSPATLSKLRGLRPTLARNDVLGVGSPDSPLTSSPVRGSYVALLLPQRPADKASSIVAAGELERIGALLDAHRTKMLIGPQATKSNLISAAPETYRVLVFATHGFLASEMLEQSEPALLMTAESGEPGPAFLTSSDVAALRLDANLILLNACSTGGSDGLLGSEALTGLASSFFFAGARSVIASLWPVVDTTATSLGVELFDLALKDPEEGGAYLLQQAMLKSLQSGLGVAKHPAYWAPYVMVGDPNVTLISH